MDTQIATSANTKVYPICIVYNYNSTFLSIHLYSLTLVLVYCTPKLFHKRTVLGAWKERVRAKGIVKKP